MDTDTIALDSILSQKEINNLKHLAAKEGKSLEELVGQVLKEMLAQKKQNPKAKKDEMIKHLSFGIWKDEIRSDEELLNSYSGDWGNFPLKDVRSA